MAKELVFATFVDMKTKTMSNLNGNTAVMVLQLEDVDRAIERVQEKSYKKLAILSRVKCGDEWRESFMEAIEEYKLPHNNKNWYRLKPLKETIERLNKTRGYKPKVYNPRRKTLRLNG